MDDETRDGIEQGNETESEMEQDEETELDGETADVPEESAEAADESDGDREVEDAPFEDSGTIDILAQGSSTKSEPKKNGKKTGRVSVLEAIRHQKRLRRLRRIILLAVLLAAALAWVTGLFGASLTAVNDLTETLRISVMREEGYPALTGISKLYQVSTMTGGYVALGPEACAVYTDGGTRLRNLQSGYARPAVAVGSTRFVMYNRGGTELRIESRTDTLYTKTYEHSILLSAVASNGNFAVVTDDARYLATLQVCSGTMEQLLSWNMTDSEGTPLHMSFSADGRKLAVATLLASNGQAETNLFVLDVRKNTQMALATANGAMPLDIRWLSSDSILVLYDNRAAVYSAVDGAEKYSFDFSGHSVTDWSFCGNSTAILLANGNSTLLTLLDSKMQLSTQEQTAEATSITLTKTAVYTTTENAVECYDLNGEYLWKQEYDTRPQAVLDGKNLLVFRDGTVELCEAPSEQ